MGELLVEMASKQTDVLFNMMSLKFKFLTHPSTCDNCKQSVEEWSIHKICHNILCEKCLGHGNTSKNNCCPLCNTMFDSKNRDIVSSEKIRGTFKQLEELIFFLLATERNTSDVFYHTKIGSNSRVTESGIHVKLSSKELSKVGENELIEDSSKDCGLKNEQLSSNNDSCDSDSDILTTDDSMVCGTPPNGSLTDFGSKNFPYREDICLTYADFNAEELNPIKIFCEMFKVRVDIKWSDEITHLVIKLNDKGTYNRTRKCINALLSHCYIISENWILQSIKKKKILLEHEFIPLDPCGEPCALLSWRIGRGIIESTMQWVKRCILYFHPSVTAHEYFSNYKDWASKVGFIVIERMEEFNCVESDLRIVLTHFQVPVEEINTDAYSELINCFESYKAIVVDFQWYLEVLSRYRFVLIEYEYQVLKLSCSMIESANLSSMVLHN